jgi:hypothetical protein
MAFDLFTLHIFGYGECQVIGKDGETQINKKAPSNQLVSLQAVVDNVYSFKPIDNNSPNKYHTISIFKDYYSNYSPDDSQYSSWKTNYDELDNLAIDLLATEILAYTEI